MCLGTLLYHENRKKSQIVVFPWVLIKSVIVLYLVFVPSLHLKFNACLFFIHWLPRITGYQLLSQRVFFFRESRNRDYNWIIFFYTWFNFDRILRRWPSTFVYFKLSGGSCRVLILFKWLVCVYLIRHTHRQFTCLDDLGLWA